MQSRTSAPRSKLFILCLALITWLIVSFVGFFLLTIQTRNNTDASKFYDVEKGTGAYQNWACQSKGGYYHCGFKEYFNQATDNYIGITFLSTIPTLWFYAPSLIFLSPYFGIGLLYLLFWKCKVDIKLPLFWTKMTKKRS